MSRNLALVMLGDCMLGRLVDESLTALPSQLSGMWGDALPLLQGGMVDVPAGEQQLVAANLECAVTAEEDKASCGSRAGRDLEREETACLSHGRRQCMPTRIQVLQLRLKDAGLIPLQDEERAFNFKLHPTNLPALK